MLFIPKKAASGAPSTVVMVAGNLGGDYDGWCGNTTWGGTTWGSYNGVSGTGSPFTHAGESVVAIHWDPGETRCYVAILGTGKQSWFTGKTIWVDGTPYTFNVGSAQTNPTFSWHGFVGSQIFASGSSYDIGWS